MDGTTTTMLTGHSTRAMQRRDGSGQLVLHSFPAADGRSYEVFEGPLADRAFSLLNHPIVVEFETQSRPRQDGGTFTNYRIKRITPTSQVPSSAPAPAPAPAPSAPLAPAQDYQRPRRPEEALQIMRQNALTNAIHTVEIGLVEGATFESLIRLAERYSDFYVHGADYVLSKAAADRAGIPVEYADDEPQVEPVPADDEQADVGPTDDVPF